MKRSSLALAAALISTLTLAGGAAHAQDFKAGDRVCYASGPVLGACATRRPRSTCPRRPSIGDQLA